MLTIIPQTSPVSSPFWGIRSPPIVVIDLLPFIAFDQMARFLTGEPPRFDLSAIPTAHTRPQPNGARPQTAVAIHFPYLTDGQVHHGGQVVCTDGYRFNCHFVAHCIHSSICAAAPAVPLSDFHAALKSPQRPDVNS